MAHTILKLQWSDKTTNKDIWERDNDWCNTLRRPCDRITGQALSWNPQGKRKKGRPRNTLRCEMESEMKRTRRIWKDLEKMVSDRRAWKDVVVDLCLQEGLERCGCRSMPPGGLGKML
jgi:hypothetical protein